jgi:hypothetical protein
MLFITACLLLAAWLVGLFSGYGQGGLAHDLLLLFGLLFLLLAFATGFEAAKRRNRTEGQ